MSMSKEQLKEYNKKYYKDNKEAMSAQMKEWYADNKEAKNAYSKKYQADNREVIRDKMYKKKYGITLVEYNAMWAEQEGYCLICNEHEDEVKGYGLVVDHNHETNEVRGLLCGSCNAAIGLLKDSPLILESAVAYLEHRGSYA